MRFEEVIENVVPPKGISPARFAAMIRCVFLGNIVKEQDIDAYRQEADMRELIRKHNLGGWAV